MESWIETSNHMIPSSIVITAHVCHVGMDAVGFLLSHAHGLFAILEGSVVTLWWSLDPNGFLQFRR